MNKMPNRFPAVVADKALICMHTVGEMMIHLEMEFAKPLDADRLERALDLLLDAEPILGCRARQNLQAIGDRAGIPPATEPSAAKRLAGAGSYSLALFPAYLLQLPEAASGHDRIGEWIRLTDKRRVQRASVLPFAPSACGAGSAIAGRNQ